MVRIWPRPTVVTPPEVGVNTMVIWPEVVTNPWMVELLVEMFEPMASCAELVPVKEPLVEVPSDQRV